MATEDVCVCGHIEGEHAGGTGKCFKCWVPPCAFFWRRFSREIVDITRVKAYDAVGDYWRTYAPHGSTAWIFAHMAPADRQEVASDCFRDANFTRDGEIDCPYCSDEYDCEVFAAYLLFYSLEEPYLSMKVEEVAELRDMPEWAVRFRAVLEVGSGSRRCPCAGAPAGPEGVPERPVH